MSGSTKLRLAIVVALAIGLRWHQIGELSLNHFDEGVLVSGAFGVWLHGPWHFPLAQPLQAPPLFPWMVAAAFALTQTTSPIMGIYLSAALGSATIIIYFALLRRIYGDGFALAGAGLLAASDLHVAFSRMALTDVPLTFWFVAGAYAFVRLVEAARADDNGDRRRVKQTIFFWAVVFGLAAGAAWNTKYNGWMLLAIPATAWMIVRWRRFVMPGADDKTHAADQSFAQGVILLAIGLAALVAIGCFAPWYIHVERSYPGGYRSVTENHLQYVGGISNWPARALRLWLSLSAFRHYGWLATLLAIASIVIGFPLRRFVGDRQLKNRVVAVVGTLCIGLAVLWAALVFGGDAVMVVIAAAAIGPALVLGRWPEILFAVWAGAFFVLTPFYHPYTRLLVPSLPAVIALVAWLIGTAVRREVPNLHGVSQADSGASPVSVGDFGLWTSDFGLVHPGALLRRAARVLLALICTGLGLAACLWQPCGLFPSAAAWQRWSCRQSYRALGDAILEANLPARAVVLCQGPPAMTLYIDRDEWAPLERVPFTFWLPHVSRDRECYLAVDFWGLYGENHQLALRAFLDHLDGLEPVAWVSNDLNLPTLLDYLAVEEVAQHLSEPWPAKSILARDHQVVMPATLNEQHAELIVLYRIDRDRLDLLDRAP